MKFERLHLVNFRRFSDRELLFAPGLNLIRGPNESGKSTIVQALMAVLFERPAASSARSRFHRRWGAEVEPRLELDFSDAGGGYHLVKDFGEKKVLLQTPDRSRALSGAKAVDARVAELLGFRDSGQYLRTACVTHDQMMSLGEDASARKLAAMLREVVVGGRENARMEKAARAMSAELDELKRGMERPTNNPGTIRRLQDEREMYIARQKDLSVGATDLLEQNERLDEVERLIEEKSPRAADLQALVEKNRRLADAERRYDEARSRFDLADRTQEAARRLEETDRSIAADFEGFPELPPGAASELRRAIEVRRSLKSLQDEIREEADRETDESAAGPPARQVRRGPKGAAAALLFAGVALVVLGIVLGAAVSPAFAAATVPGLICAGIGSWLLAARRGEAGSPEEPSGEPEVKPLEEPLARAAAQVERIDEREREFLRSVGCETSEEFFEKHEEFSKMKSARAEEAAALEALLAGRGAEEVEADRRKAAVAVAACDDELAELAAFRLSPGELEAAVREHRTLLAELDELETERDGLVFHLAKTASDPEDALKIEEVVSWLWEAEKTARRRLRVVALAGDAMREASEEMLASSVPVLAGGVGRTFSRLTGGRYDTVEVREGDLSMSVYSPEKGEMIPAGELLSTLSKGTASQLYLSARLELVGLLSAGRRPPLIFDDSFSYFDDARLEALWAELEEVAREQQVLLFTCTDRYDRLAGGVNVIDLPPGP